MVLFSCALSNFLIANCNDRRSDLTSLRTCFCILCSSIKSCQFCNRVTAVAWSFTTPMRSWKAPPLPEFYWRTHDPFVALGAVAAVTTTLKLGTGICLVAQRDPILELDVVVIDRPGRLADGPGAGGDAVDRQASRLPPKNGSREAWRPEAAMSSRALR